MKQLEHLPLRNMIDIRQFAIIQSELASLVDVSMVTVDTEGVPIGELSNFTTFCQLVRSSPIGRRSCEECDRVASLRALQAGRPLTYDCHCGLKDCTAPIIVDGIFVGGVLGGQVFVREEDRAKVDTERISRVFGLDHRRLEQKVAELKVVSESYLQKSLQFYSFMANYFASSGMKNLIEEKLARERQELVLLQQIAQEQELKRMQAQMNPHFLFNALNSIARIAYLEEAKQTENLIYDLSNYLRYSIKNSQATPKLSQELENLHNYLSIQNTRFSDRIHVSVTVDPGLLDWCIPSMTLQPIVENAITHGLEDRKEGGRVTVTGVRAKNDTEMLLTVHDNGEGFPEDILALFRQGNGACPNTQLGLGLVNTHERIKRLCGNEYGLTIQSEPGEYSCVSIRLPKRLGG